MSYWETTSRVRGDAPERGGAGSQQSQGLGFIVDSQSRWRSDKPCTAAGLKKKKKKVPVQAFPLGGQTQAG